MAARAAAARAAAAHARSGGGGGGGSGSSSRRRFGARRPCSTAAAATTGTTTTAEQQQQQQPRSVAVIGAGFAGLSVAYHLLRDARTPVAVDVYDARGIGGGASAVAGGLLHPLSPRGKPLWRGEEAFGYARELVAVAEAAMSADKDGTVRVLARRDGVLRPARTPKQARDFEKFAGRYSPLVGHADGAEAQAIVRGLAAPEGGAALLAPSGMVIDSSAYLHALWNAAKQLPGGGRLELVEQRVGTSSALTRHPCASASSCA